MKIIAWLLCYLSAAAIIYGLFVLVSAMGLAAHYRGY